MISIVTIAPTGTDKKIAIERLNSDATSEDVGNNFIDYPNAIAHEIQNLIDNGYTITKSFTGNLKFVLVGEQE